jgi:hypothetical protein
MNYVIKEQRTFVRVERVDSVGKVLGEMGGGVVSNEMLHSAIVERYYGAWD